MADREVEPAWQGRRRRLAARALGTRAGRLIVAAVVGAVAAPGWLVPGAAPGLVARAWAGTHQAASRAGVADPSAFDWPELHGGPQLAGYAANGTVSAPNAGTLGVRWAVDLYSATLDSPVVAYDASLGQTLAYIGTDNGDFFAVDVATGAIVWAVRLDGPVRASPLVSNGAVWAGTASGPTIYKLNASTGAIDCSQAASQPLLSSPVAATPPGGVPSVYFATTAGPGSGQVLSVSAASCAVQWTFSGYPVTAGTWDPLSYAVDATGEPLVVFGSSDPDHAAYAVDAVTGAEVWRFQITGTGDIDVGSGVTISAPGTNGFADGVAYVPGKDGSVYALDLTTGAQIWVASLGSSGGVPNESLSTAALDGTDLVVGDAVGVSDFNAVSGALRWTYQTPTTTRIVPPGPWEVISSPAISGPAGQEVVAFGDLGGTFRVLSLATGQQLYGYQTGNWISGSPAVSNGDVLAGSADGFLYDFSAGAGNQQPVAAITSPARGAVVANPGGDITVSGTASGAAGVAAVVAAVRQGGSDGTWWDAATSSWSATPVTLHATLASPGATSTGWSASFPVPPSGNAYRVDAYAVAVNGPSAVPAANDDFFVSPAAGGPALTVSPAFAAPGTQVTVRGTGFGAKETVPVSLLGAVLGSATSRADGSLPATQVKVPASAGFGPTALLATGATSGKAAAARVTVSGNWPQLGGGPGRAGREPNDAVIQNTIDPGQGILLYPAWQFAAGATPTAPAVVGQVVYEGDGTGTLHALRARDGTQLWAWHTPAGQAITGSPAVDPAAGLAFAGAANGTLYAVHTSGPSAGKLAWSATVGTGTVQSPAYAGTTVYAASAGGRVTARAEATGARIWSVSLAHGAAAAPALDPASKILVIPTSAGVTAVSAATGTARWSIPLSQPTSPVVAGGTAYIGSGDHHVYAVSESTGKRVWSFPTGGAVQDSGALGSFRSASVNALFIGSADGNLYALDTATGAQLFTYPLGASASGVAIAGNSVLATTSSGLVDGVRDYGGGLVWSYATGGGALNPPAVVNGTFYAASANGTLWAFTPYGAPPL